MKEEDRGGDESLARFKFEGLRNSETLIGRFRRQHFDWSLSQMNCFLSKLFPGFGIDRGRRYRLVDSKLVVRILQLLVFYLHCSL